MFCRYCGNELLEDAKFCNNCGKAVDAGQPEQKTAPEPTQAAPKKVDPAMVAYTTNRTFRKTGSKKIVIAAIIALLVAIAGVFGVRAANEKAMKQQVPQGIYEDSKEKVVAHYDETMAYPYGSELGYVYGCYYPTFKFAKGDQPNTFIVDGELEVEDKSQEDRPSYKVGVHGTVTTNFFRSEWSAEWTLTYQDPEYSDPANENGPYDLDGYSGEEDGYNADPNLSALPINKDYPLGYYEKNDGEGIEITYISDDGSISFGFFEAQGWYHGGQWMEPNFTISSDWFDVTSDTWNLNVNGVSIQFFIYDTHITVNASGSLGGMSADAISGNYYCLEQAIDIQ